MFSSDSRNVAKPVRIALGALIIQAHCDYSDRELVQQVTENPYLQYFLGPKEYQLTRPFTSAILVKFCKRFPCKWLNKINERILAAETAQILQEQQESA
ncbi:transposase [Sporomusa sphaeroides]|uniref:transposase n=1 Tax=Sporomusa sphaeroides TaxID=47679 RepID=UPI002CC0923F|nr:transposase [Sporomusa sphaeroides]HML34170.1 transposase [Sporomusa sphaeroides]